MYLIVFFVSGVSSTERMVDEDVSDPETADETQDPSADQEEEAVPEKLADEDERKEKWYRRAFFTVFPKLRRGVYVTYCILPCRVCCRTTLQDRNEHLHCINMVEVYVTKID